MTTITERLTGNTPDPNEDPADWPWYASASQIPWNTLKAYYDRTTKDLGGKADSWTFIVIWLGPIIVAAAFALTIQLFFRQGLTPLHWGYIPACALIGGVLSRHFFKEIAKTGMWPVVCGRMTIVVTNPSNPTARTVKIKDHYYRLTRYHEPDIHHGGALTGSITVVIALGETPYPGRPDETINSISQINWQLVNKLPAEKKSTSSLRRGFTTRATQAVYGKVYAVTVHGETEAGVNKLVTRGLRELAGWLPAFLIWLAILISMSTGFSVNATIAEYVSNLPEGVQSLISHDSP